MVVPWHNSTGYIYLIALLNKFSQIFDGFNTMLPRLFNGFALGLIGFATYKIALNLDCKIKHPI